MEIARSHWVEAQVELVMPAELKARLAQGRITLVGLRKVGCTSGEAGR